jgi:hypothetical protein
MRGERPRLGQQLVDQGRLAMIDVGDDGDVPEGARGGHVALQKEKPAILPVGSPSGQKNLHNPSVTRMM